MIDLNLLQSFTQVVESGSFRSAATQHYKSQPVLSYQIKQLESFLGFKLFDRKQYRATLTSAGKDFLPKAMSLIQQAEELSTYRDSHKTGQESTLSISVSSLYPLQRLSQQLHQLKEKFPDTNILLSIDTLAGIEKIKQNEIDFAIVEHDPDDFTIQSEPCSTMNMILVISNKHPLAKQKEHHVQELLTLPQIVLKSSGSKPVADQGVFKHVKKWIVNDMTTKKQLILDGFGWGFLPDHMIQNDIHKKRLIPLNMTITTIKNVTFHKVSRFSTKPGPVLTWLTENI